MNCQECTQLLVEHLEGLLTSEQSNHVRQHLASCAACSEEAGRHESLRSRLVSQAGTWETTPLPGRVMDQILREQTFNERKRKMRKRYGIIGIGLAAAIALAIVSSWPGDGKQGSALAAIVHQLQSARTAHLRMVVTDPEANGGHATTQDIYLKAPDKVRGETEDPVTRLKTILIVNGDKAVTLHPAMKLYAAAPSTGFPASAASDVLGLLANPPGLSRQDATSRPALDGSIQWQLVSLGTQERDGRRLEKCRLEQSDGRSKTPTGANGTNIFCWVDPAAGQVVLVTHERTVNGVQSEVSRTSVELNPELSDDLFSTARPTGYSEGKLSADLTTLLTTYDKAREKISKYRLIAWTGKPERPSLRAAVRGKDLYAEYVEPSKARADLEFDAVWNQLQPSPSGVSLFSTQGKATRILRHDGKIEDVREDLDPNITQSLVAGMGWPQLPVSLLHAMFVPDSEYRSLPPRPDRPGLVGFQYSSYWKQQDTGSLCIYWVDPNKDFLCVYYERYQRKGTPWKGRPDWQPDEELMKKRPENGGWEHDEWRQITSFARTPKGHWYADVVSQRTEWVGEGKRWLWPEATMRITVDFAGNLSDSLFVVPADALKARLK